MRFEKQIKAEENGKVAEPRREGEISDEELNNVTGGGCADDERPQPKFQVRDTVYLGNPMNTAKIESIIRYDEKKGYVYGIYFLRKHENGTAYEREMTIC